jgi:esterase/lipase superfamily enzyme
MRALSAKVERRPPAGNPYLDAGACLRGPAAARRSRSTTETTEGTSRVRILIATTCQRASDEAAEMFNKERAEAMSYAPIAVPQRVGSRPGEMLRAGKTDQ